MSTGFAGPPLTLWVYGDERGDDPMRKWEPHDSIYVWKKTFSIIYTIKIENKKKHFLRESDPPYPSRWTHMLGWSKVERAIDP